MRDHGRPLAVVGTLGGSPHLWPPNMMCEAPPAPCQRAGITWRSASPFTTLCLITGTTAVILPSNCKTPTTGCQTARSLVAPLCWVCLGPTHIDTLLWPRPRATHDESLGLQGAFRIGLAVGEGGGGPELRNKAQPRAIRIVRLQAQEQKQAQEQTHPRWVPLAIAIVDAVMVMPTLPRHARRLIPHLSCISVQAVSAVRKSSRRFDISQYDVSPVHPVHGPRLGQCPCIHRRRQSTASVRSRDAV